VAVEGLTKKFGDFVAVDDVSFHVKRGEVFGFLGPNGAGKSTTIRMLCGILKPTAGDGFVEGNSIREESDRIKMITGYMSQKFSLYHDLTPYENLEFYSGVYGLDRDSRRERITWALEISGLMERKDHLTGNLPAGYQQRLALGAAILHEPSILFLDEPTAGVDPLSRRDFWDLIYRLSSSGVTVFVTTHYMDEAEHCDRVAFIDKGRLIKLESPAAMKSEKRPEKIFEIKVAEWKPAFDLLRKDKTTTGRVSLFGTDIHLSIRSERRDYIESILRESGIEVISFREITPSLEDVFVSTLQSED
jgi:ABC-2 type transport system ATP-binding protein